MEKEHGYQPFISVVVPVYNVEPYLERCVRSITEQSYKKMEILLVDDGSTDGSGALCDRLAEADGRIKVIHKANGGASSARNAGLAKARGEWIGFVDSDDYIENEMYAEMVEAIQDKVDIICCGTAIIYPDNMKRKPYVYGKMPEKTFMEKQDALRELFLLQNLNFSVCDKLFRRHLFEGLTFPLGKTCEDLPVTYELVKKSRGVINIGKVKYFYFYRESSASHKEFAPNRLNYVLFVRDMLKDISENYPSLTMTAESLYLRSIADVLRQIDVCSDWKKYRYIRKRLQKVLIRMIGRMLGNKEISKELRKYILASIWCCEKRQ